MNGKKGSSGQRDLNGGLNSRKGKPALARKKNTSLKGGGKKGRGRCVSQKKKKKRVKDKTGAGKELISPLGELVEKGKRWHAGE